MITYILIYVIGFFVLDLGVLLACKKWPIEELRLFRDSDLLRLAYAAMWPITIPVLTGVLLLSYVLKFMLLAYRHTLKRLESLFQ